MKLLNKKINLFQLKFQKINELETYGKNTWDVKYVFVMIFLFSIFFFFSYNCMWVIILLAHLRAMTMLPAIVTFSHSLHATLYSSY